MALDFDGVDDFVNHGNITAINDSVGLTICLWVLIDISEENDGLVSKNTLGAGTDGWNFALGVGAGSGLKLSFGTAGNVNFGTTVAILSTATWTHVAILYDGNGAANADKCKIYKDAVEQALTFTGTLPASIPTSTEPVRVPRGREIAFLDGRVAHVKIWTAVLTQAEIQQEMNSYRPVRTANLTLWSPYDDGTSAGDYSGAANHGTVTGALQIAGPPVGGGFPVTLY